MNISCWYAFCQPSLSLDSSILLFFYNTIICNVSVKQSRLVFSFLLPFCKIAHQDVA